MKSFNHVIAATDLSAPSRHAVDRGFVIASQTIAQLTVVHALGLDALAPWRGLLGDRALAITQSLTEEARKELLDITGDPSRNRGVTAAVQLEQGLASSAVSDFADAANASLIVLGAHGTGFLQRLLLGSTASRLLRKSKCPVLVVKNPARDAYRRMLVAVDFSTASLLALNAAHEIAPCADIWLLSVVEVPFEGKLRYAGVREEEIARYRMQARELAVRQLHELAASAGLAATQYTARVAHGDATQQILAEEQTANCDLIVMGKHGTHVTEELLLGSVTKHVLAESLGDVLVVTDKRPPSL